MCLLFLFLFYFAPIIVLCYDLSLKKNGIRIEVVRLTINDQVRSWEVWLKKWFQFIAH